MSDEFWRMSAVEAVARLRQGEISPLELVEASARRIAEVEPAVNALPTLCLDRARDHARRIMQGDPACGAADEAGWLAGLPVSIKDLTDVAGVRTTYGSPLFADHVPEKSHPLVERIERKGGIVMGKSNTPEFGAGGSTFNEVFGRTRNPWNTSVPNLWSQLSVQGPMARNVAGLALFLDAMAGFCPLDPLTFDAPAISFSDGLARPAAPKRVAFTADYNGRMPIDREVHEICTKAARRFEELGCIVEEVSPDIGAAEEALHILRGQQFVVDRELQLRSHRDKLKPDIVWNTERGLNQTPSDIARAERERAAFYRRMVEFFGAYDLLVTPGALTPAFDVNLRNAPAIGGQKLDNYMGGSTATAVITISACPAMAVPCGFDQYGRPVGLQLVGKPRGEAALLQAAALFEQLLGLHRLLPIDPRSGTVPPTS